MRKNAAQLAVAALEKLGVTHTFGIPGVHNTEFYDALHASEQITPILVTHEGGAAFMADGMSRVRQMHEGIGVLAIVPAAGFTHAASGIGEAYLDGVPMLVISGGVRTDTEFDFVLHGVDQLELAKGITKGAFRVNHQNDVTDVLYQAYQLATEGKPGPVLVEIPVNLQLFDATVAQPQQPPQPTTPAIDEQAIQRAVELISAGKRPGLFVGWGARHAQQPLIDLAEYLQAPVATTLQGLSVFPHDHPLHVGFGFSASAVPAAQASFKDCDLMIAIGTRFAEIPTGSFSAKVPENLIHIDIDESVFNRNYPSKVSIRGDATEVLRLLNDALHGQPPRPENASLKATIKQLKQDYFDEWQAHDSHERINPYVFFTSIAAQMMDDAIIVLDDGNHTYLAAELLPLKAGMTLLTPTDYNAMGYAVPAAIGAKLAQPERQTIAIVGDGCFVMTGMELLTAQQQEIGVVCFVFNDGELSQIAQAQQTPYARKPCTALVGAKFEGMALATGAHYIRIETEAELDAYIAQAFDVAAKGQSVLVDVNIDYSKPTRFTQGTVKSTFKRFPTRQKLRIAGRAVKRKLFG